MSNDGIKLLGRGRAFGGGALWQVRVKRVEARTGRVRNRKALVHGTKADALRRRDEIRAELASTTARRARTRLVEFATAWLQRRQGVLKPSTVRKYFHSLEHIVPVLGDLYLDAITPADVEAYVARRVRDAAGNTVLNELRLLRVLARDAQAESYSTRYWCERVKAPKVARYSVDRPNLLTEDEARRLFEHLPAAWYGLVLLLMTTGLRIGEATALRWSDLDAAASVARIRRTNWKGNALEPKNKSSVRNVPLLPEVMRALVLGGHVHSDADHVFPARGGGMHRGSPLRRVLDRACAAAGITRVTAHGLRRTFNDLARVRGEAQVLRSITGHATEQMTEHYSLVRDREKAELSRSVASAIGVLPVSDARTAEPSR